MANTNQRKTIFVTEALSGELCKGLARFERMTIDSVADFIGLFEAMSTV